jgi:fructosamine-3-kinase
LTATGEQEEPGRAAGEALGLEVVGLEPCAGGDINRAFRLELEDSRSAFLKCRPGADAVEFADEAAGLAWLAEPAGLRVPEVLAVVEDPSWPGLVLEWIEAGGALSPEGEEELGRGLAVVHLSGAGHPGARAPGSDGETVRFGRATLAAPPADGSRLTVSGLYSLRIEDLARQALETGAIQRGDAAAISRAAEEIDRFSGPPVPPVRLHGDLWTGNIIADRDGRPWLIDPAPYGGHPEIDLAMLELFGAPSQRFLGAYREVAPLADGAGERRLLWQIQPLLVHAVLFGGHYGAAAVRAALNYVGR